MRCAAVRALTDGLSDMPPVPEAVRAAVRREAEGRAAAELHADLRTAGRHQDSAAALPSPDGHGGLVPGLELRSVIVVPLRARGRFFGTIALGRHDPSGFADWLTVAP